MSAQTMGLCLAGGLLSLSACSAEIGTAGEGLGGTPGGELSPLTEKDPISLGGEGDANLIDHDALFECEDPDTTASPPRIWRLTSDQLRRLYGHIADTLQNGSGHSIAGYVSPFGAAPADTRFPNYASSFGLDDLELETILENGRNLKVQVVDKGPGRSDWKCLGESPWSDECARSVAQKAASILLRRAPSEEELDRYLQLYVDVKAETNEDLALETMFQAIGASPEALFRFELGGNETDAAGRARLTPAEIADALAFSLTGGPPGDDLLKAMNDGTLDSDEGVEAEARRLTEDLSENAAALQFLQQYYLYPEARKAFKDPHPDAPDFSFDGDDMVRETDQLMQDAVALESGFWEFLMTTTKNYVGSQSAPAYNMSLPKGEFGSFEIPERSGILTQPSWLSHFAHADATDPIHRGRFVYVDMLCNVVPAIPLEVVPVLPEDDTLTERERLAQHSSDGQCAGCHSLMDPIGLGMEQFDQIGRFRTTEKGAPVDASGNLIGSDVDGAFTGTAELADKLADSRRAAECFIRHAFRFYLGRNERLADSCSMLDAANGFFDNQQSFKEMLIALVTSDAFLYRRADPTGDDK